MENYQKMEKEFVEILRENEVETEYKVIESTKGHDCFLLEPQLFKKIIGNFL